MLVIDETLERRAGKRIRYKGRFYDAVRSTAQRVAVTTGIWWRSLCLVVRVPWSQRLWALPFLGVPVLSEQTCRKLKKPHRSGTQWAAWMLAKVRRGYPQRQIVLVGDGEYGTVALIRASPQGPGILVGRLRWDASLWAFVGPQPRAKRGLKPKKGARLPSLRQRLTDPATVWTPVTLTWYGGDAKPVAVATGACLWWRPGSDPVPLRFCLVRPLPADPEPFLPGVFFCSDTGVRAQQMVTWFLGRHQVEVTFQEVRSHLGFETQRQWSQRALERTTPCRFGVFSLGS